MIVNHPLPLRALSGCHEALVTNLGAFVAQQIHTVEQYASKASGGACSLDDVEWFGCSWRYDIDRCTYRHAC